MDRIESSLQRLIEGNKLYVALDEHKADVSDKRRLDLSKNGQQPFATIVSCADSRVVPEHMFSCGLGELFTVSVAGNIIDTDELGSCIYAAEHLHTPVIVVLGHTQCGAINSAINDEVEGPLGELITKIKAVIKDETDSVAAAKINVRAGVRTLQSDPEIAQLEQAGAVKVLGGLYHLDTGFVEFFE